MTDAIKLAIEALEDLIESVTGVDQVSAVDEARAALTAAQQAQPPAPGEAAREYMTGYSDGREWAKPSQALVVEPVYQYQLANGNWIDQTKESYDYNVKHGQATVRMLYATPQAAAITYMTGYSDCKEWAVIAEHQQLAQAAQPERAPLSDEQKRILFECVEQVKDGNELDYYLLGFEAAENAYGIKHGEGEHYEPMPIMRGMLP